VHDVAPERNGDPPRSCSDLSDALMSGKWEAARCTPKRALSDRLEPLLPLKDTLICVIDKHNLRMGKARPRKCPVCGAPLKSGAGAWGHAYKHLEEAAREGIITMERVGGSWVIRYNDKTIIGAGWTALEELAPVLRSRWRVWSERDASSTI